MIRLVEIFRYFLYLGTCGFGGPLGLAAHMKKDLVEKKNWITEQEYLDGLAAATILPGPIAFQLGIYCGWVRRNILGGIVAGVSFIITPFFLCVLLGFLYQKYRSLPWMGSLFYGVAPVVLALIWNACLKLGKTTLKNTGSVAIFIVSFYIAFRFQFNFIYLLLGAGILNAIINYRKISNVCMSLYWPLFFFFFKAGLFIFGSGLVIVPFLQQFVVEQFHWINSQAFLDGISIGMISPGPVLITATFVGFLTAGFSGACVATAGIFLPSFILIFAGAPLLKRYQKNTHLQNFVRGITAAVVAVIAASTAHLTQQIAADLPTILVIVVTLCLLRWRNIPDPMLVGAGALFGLLWKSL